MRAYRKTPPPTNKDPPAPYCNFGTSRRCVVLTVATSKRISARLSWDARPGIMRITIRPHGPNFAWATTAVRIQFEVSQPRDLFRRHPQLCARGPRPRARYIDNTLFTSYNGSAAVVSGTSPIRLLVLLRYRYRRSPKFEKSIVYAA